MSKLILPGQTKSPSLKLKTCLVEDTSVILIDKLVSAKLFTDRNDVIGAALAALMAGLIEMQRQAAAARQAEANKETNEPSTERPGNTGESEGAEGPGTSQVDRPVGQKPEGQA